MAKNTCIPCLQLGKQTIVYKDKRGHLRRAHSIINPHNVRLFYTKTVEWVRKKPEPEVGIKIETVKGEDFATEVTVPVPFVQVKLG